MIACDTSVVVAAFARWHEAHDRAVAALARVDGFVDHVGVESFSVLTRLPPPRRAPPDLIVRFLAHHFPSDVVRLPGPGSAAVIDAARTGGVVGGAVYDLLVGLSASSVGATLLSLDHRAAITYRAAGVHYELLDKP